MQVRGIDMSPERKETVKAKAVTNKSAPVGPLIHLCVQGGGTYTHTHTQRPGGPPDRLSRGLH